jgi:hypothetical protein
MTIDELSAEMQVSRHYLLHHWKRITEAAAKRNIKLVKCGKGASANYGVIENGASFARFEYKGEKK